MYRERLFRRSEIQANFSVLTVSWLFSRENGSAFLAETGSWEIPECVRNKMSTVLLDHKKWGRRAPTDLGGAKQGPDSAKLDRIFWKQGTTECPEFMWYSFPDFLLHFAKVKCPVTGCWGHHATSDPEGVCTLLVTCNRPWFATDSDHHQERASVSSLQIFGWRKCCCHGNNFQISKASISPCVGANSPWEADSGRRIITMQARDEYLTFLMLNDLTGASALSEKLCSFRV